MHELLTRAAAFEPSSFNAESGTVQVIFSTGADVQRRDHSGLFIERLNMSAASWDLTAFDGAPVLDNHDRFSVRAILGVVERPEITGGRGLATVRFGTRPDVQAIAADVGAGIIRGVSIGYTVREWTDSTESGVRIRTARGIKPVELSFTALGADSGATIRSEGGSSMDQEKIRTLAAGLGVPPEYADALSQRNLPDADVRREMIAEASRRLPQIDTRRPAEVSPVTEPEALSVAMGEALYCRTNQAHQPSELARQFAGRRFADMARALLLHRNLNSMGSDAEVITRAGQHVTGDFANVLGTLAGKVLAVAYSAAPSGVKTVAWRAAPHADFRGRNIVRRGELPTLDVVPEGAEYKYGSIADGKQSYSITTRGKIFSITRQALINDDVGAFADLAAGWGLAAAETENAALVAKLTENSGTGPTLGDSVVMFHSSHGNVAGSGAAISDTTLGAARLALRTMKGL
ncbi:MAG: peptidase U35, partial [Alphaproteobacteria bacterium]|nr:peptidase U35 [Alphaproteobacteria bacterium]